MHTEIQQHGYRWFSGGIVVTCQQLEQLKAHNNQLKNTQSFSCININQQAPERANIRQLKPDGNMVDPNGLGHNTCNYHMRSNSAEKKHVQINPQITQMESTHMPIGKNFEPVLIAILTVVI